ncbi:MAG TPA: twin-arginine translocation signal domain-containing protein [Candidatus Dormibacteraeota bacterium]|nr:twin-arginine translocation signal domain-containing protein [Candidatus Dormibacteraeota bacterium]
MKDVVLSRRQLLKGAGAVGVLGALGIPTTVFADGTKIRWDIISVNFGTGTLSAGGMASARANDNSKITLTGNGTFGSGEDGGVTGGGTWHTFGPTLTPTGTGAPTGNGTYKVTRLVSWVPAPGTPPLPNDNIGIRANQSAGLAVLKIRYSDGSRGLLTISCDLVGTPMSVFEGITATKGFVDYWNREAPPAPPGNADRTNFHVLSQDSED